MTFSATEVNPMKKQMITTLCILTTLLLASTEARTATKPVTQSTDITVVTKGAITTISATVSNPHKALQKAGIVNVTAVDSKGQLVANLGMPVVVKPKSSLTVSRQWQAPSYATTLTWKAKLVAYREAPMDHYFGWKYPGLQHRMTEEARNPMSCTTCHSVTLVDRDAKMSCYNCHDKKWN